MCCSTVVCDAVQDITIPAASSIKFTYLSKKKKHHLFIAPTVCTYTTEICPKTDGDGVAAPCSYKFPTPGVSPKLLWSRFKGIDLNVCSKQLQLLLAFSYSISYEACMQKLICNFYCISCCCSNTGSTLCTCLHDLYTAVLMQSVF